MKILRVLRISGVGQAVGKSQQLALQRKVPKNLCTAKGTGYIASYWTTPLPAPITQKNVDSSLTFIFTCSSPRAGVTACSVSSKSEHRTSVPYPQCALQYRGGPWAVLTLFFPITNEQMTERLFGSLAAFGDGLWRADDICEKSLHRIECFLLFTDTPSTRRE